MLLDNSKNKKNGKCPHPFYCGPHSLSTVKIVRDELPSSRMQLEVLVLSQLKSVKQYGKGYTDITGSGCAKANR